MSEEFSVVGKRLPRPEAVEKSTGAARYTVDLRLPGMLMGKVLRSPYPHAKIVGIDKSKAEKLPGVEAVLTFEDVPKRKYNMAMDDLLIRDREARAKRVKDDQYVLTDKARYVGDPVAAVAAINESIAEEALGLIEVAYDRLQAVFDPVEAIKPGAPGIHDYPEGNHIWRHPFPTPEGDVEKGFQEADHIIEETFRTSRQKHCVLEPVTCVANFEPNISPILL